MTGPSADPVVSVSRFASVEKGRREWVAQICVLEAKACGEDLKPSADETHSHFQHVHTMQGYPSDFTKVQVKSQAGWDFLQMWPDYEVQ